MGQWGKPYTVREFKDGAIVMKRMKPHYPSQVWEPALEGTEPDRVVCMEEKVLWTAEQVAYSLKILPESPIWKGNMFPQDDVQAMFDGESTHRLMIFGIMVPLDLLKQFWTPESLCEAITKAQLQCITEGRPW